jgi:spermidine synthase
VSARYEELDYQPTPMGDLVLRRRREPTLDLDVYEVKLGEEYLMSSLFTEAEEQLARIGLAAVRDPTGERAGLDVLVGGLGLGYTAVAALEDARVASLVVVDALPAVIDWHERGLLPVSTRITGDPRATLELADFFALARAEPAGRSWDAILVDIDHTPRHSLDPSHADLYTRQGLLALKAHLRPGGVFALWSDDPPDDPFMVVLGGVFAQTAAEIVDFDNPLTGGVSSNTVYVAHD